MSIYARIVEIALIPCAQSKTPMQKLLANIVKAHTPNVLCRCSLLRATGNQFLVLGAAVDVLRLAAAATADHVRTKKYMKNDFYNHKSALVTGGSSGIGLAIAKKLAARGANVSILARRPEQLEIAQQEILAQRANPNQIVNIIAADVSNLDQIQNVLLTLPTPDILINSAGVALPGFVNDLPVEKYRWMMDINYFGTVHVTKTLLPGMLQRRSGTIVNISSFLGVVSIHGYSAYSATKYAIRGFTDALRAELHREGIQVSIVFPDDTDTPQFAEEMKHRPAIVSAIWGDSPPMSPDKVAEDLLNGVAKGHYMIVPGFKTRLLFDIVFFAGRRIHRIINLLETFGLRSLRKKKG